MLGNVGLRDWNVPAGPRAVHLPDAYSSAIDDLGSLNGTYVNRRRIESHKLQNGDELQVGKYKLTYLEER